MSCILCQGRRHVGLTLSGVREHVWCWWCVGPSFSARRPYDGPPGEAPGRELTEAR